MIAEPQIPLNKHLKTLDSYQGRYPCNRYYYCSKPTRFIRHKRKDEFADMYYLISHLGIANPGSIDFWQHIDRFFYSNFLARYGKELNDRSFIPIDKSVPSDQVPTSPKHPTGFRGDMDGCTGILWWSGIYRGMKMRIPSASDY